MKMKIFIGMSLIVISACVSSNNNNKNNSNPWSVEAQNEYILSCKEKAKANIMSDSEINDYCQCSLEKTMEKYPSVESTVNISIGEVMSISQDCLNGILKKKGLSTTNKENKLISFNPPLIVQGSSEGNCKVFYPPGLMPVFNNVTYEDRILINYKTIDLNYKVEYDQKWYEMAFVACIEGSNVAELYVNKDPVEEFTGNEHDIYFRKEINLQHGYNRIPVKAIGKSGKIGQGYIEITINN